MGFFPFSAQRNNKETVCVNVAFFTTTASLAFQIVKYLKRLSLNVGHVQVSVLKGQVKEGSEFFSLVSELHIVMSLDTIPNIFKRAGPENEYVLTNIFSYRS